MIVVWLEMRPYKPMVMQHTVIWELEIVGPLVP